MRGPCMSPEAKVPLYAQNGSSLSSLLSLFLLSCLSQPQTPPG